jgi:hypothetical protein
MKIRARHSEAARQRIWANDDAIGLSYEYDADTAKTATITAVSGSGAELTVIEKARFPVNSDPQATAGPHIQFQELEPGVMRTTYDLSNSRSLEWFMFVLMGNMGHVVFL